MEFNFILKRLKRMSASEIIYRFKNELVKNIDGIAYKSYKFDDEVIDENVKIHFNWNDIEIANKEALLRKSNDICNNVFDIFALKSIKLGDKINFHKDYKSGLASSPYMMGKKIDYRASDKIGDIKYIWELNRHLFLLNLALAYNSTKDKKYLSKFEILLFEWFEQNPFMMGLNWTSSLELGIRLINWTLCWQILSDVISKELKDQWLKSIYRHCWYINRSFSFYSSANNHLIGEAAGLFIASSALPQFKKSNVWQKRSHEILQRECLKQNYEDGVNKEQAIYYLHFVLDLLLISGIIGKKVTMEFSSDYWNRIERMLEYSAAVEDVSGGYPHFGDADDGLVLDLGQVSYGINRSLLNTGAYLFNRPEFLKDGWTLDDKSRTFLWLASIPYENIQFGIEKRLPVSFKDGGYYVLGANLGTEKEQKLIFDCGPLGFLSIAAHGHADALSFTLTAGGCPLFIDPGTYSYHADKLWRNYFRSTRAHNTVCIDDDNQSIISGSFMWSSCANAILLDYRNTNYVKGMHNGYLRFKNSSIIHIREISYNLDENKWNIRDELDGIGNHIIEICFHLSPECMIEYVDKNAVFIKFSKGICRLSFEDDIQCRTFFGDENLPLGWCSTAYDRKQPTYSIIFRKSINEKTTINTGIKIKFN